MSDNLMDLIKGAVSKQVMGQIGGILGQDEQKTSGIFEKAAGSILGGLIKKASTPDGADEIFKSAQDHDDSVLDKLGDILGGGQQATDDFQKSGGGILDGVFGKEQGGILSVLAKFLGIDEGMMGTVLKMAAPIVMGVIGRYMKQKALNAVGLGKFLGEQKSHLGGMMPAALTSSLGFGDLLGNVGDSVGAVGNAASNVGNAVGNAADKVGDAASDAASAGGSLLKMILPLVVLGLLAWLIYTFVINGGADDVVDGVKKGVENTAAIVPDLANVDFGSFDMNGLKGQLDGITTGIKDVTADNAEGLAGKIKGLTDSMGGMGFDALGGPAKDAVGGVLNGFTKTLTGSMGGIKDEGILGILKPVIEMLLEKIKSFGF